MSATISHAARSLSCSCHCFGRWCLGIQLSVHDPFFHIFRSEQLAGRMTNPFSLHMSSKENMLYTESLGLFGSYRTFLVVYPGILFF
jgi:hypothetical protein